MKKGALFLLVAMVFFLQSVVGQAEGRYEKIFSDGSLGYYMDVEGAKWIKKPDENNRYIIDVWIKLQPEVYNSLEAEEYTEAPGYYLEHYYLDTKERKIQFLGQLEVRERPANDIGQHKYRQEAWENLVPESIEDSIYRGVVGKMASSPEKGKRGDLGDLIEDVFRVAI